MTTLDFLDRRVDVYGDAVTWDFVAVTDDEHVPRGDCAYGDSDLFVVAQGLRFVRSHLEAVPLR